MFEKLHNNIKHRINLIDPTPFKQRHRRIPPSMIEDVRQHIEQLLASGVIRPSKSPFTSNVVLVRKKTGKLRLCVDYRMLNERTIKDAYSLPRMEEIFDCMHGAKFFSTLDMKSGYHQVGVEECHKERTAFTVGALGFYEYNQMPFGLCNAPATMQRWMQDCLGDLNMTICMIYLDDIIIFSDSFEQHLERLSLVLQKLNSCGIKLAPEKCFFFQPKIHFLGHVVSSEGIETSPEKIEKVKNYPVPENADKLRSFLAFAGYYRRFIKDFSKIVRPLSELLPPTSEKKSKQKVKVEWRWTEEHQKVFDHLKDLLTSAPILAYPDFSEPFELHTDASTKALGAVLYQTQEGKKRVIAYASRALSKSEKNYSAFKLEYLALKWAVTEKFSDYLIANHFSVLTDNNPLTHILRNAKLDATGQRWASALGEYSFDISYRAGIKNADADGMSRYPYPEEKDEKKEEKKEEKEKRIQIDEQSVKAVCSDIHQTSLIEILPSASINIVETLEEQGQVLAQKELFEIRRMQRQDPLLETWRRAVIDKALPKKFLRKDDLTMKRNFKSLFMKRGLLFRKVQDEEREIEQLVLPDVYKQEVLTGIHDDVGHPGIERTNRLIRERFYWPGMLADVEHHVKTCNRCLRRKSKINQRAPLHNVNTTYPLELVCMDFLKLEKSRGMETILIITDHYTKYALAIPTKNQTAKTTAEVFYNSFIVNYGIPTRIHADQGANFESTIIKELCTLTNMNKSHTTPYHPQGNAGPERFNRTLLDMLGTLESSQKRDWTKYVSSLVFAYNSTPHEATRVSPYELMFGRRPKLPIDTVFENAREDSTGNKETKEYISNLKQRMEKTREIVDRHTQKSKDKQKKYYDRKAKPANFHIGDKVLVKIVAFDGRHKIQDRFEEEIYTIEDQQNKDIPVYKIRCGDTCRTLHRNLLFLIENQEDRGTDRVAEDQTASRELEVNEEDKDASKDMNEESDVTKEHEDSDSENEYGFVLITRQDGDAHSSATDETEVKSKESEKDSGGDVRDVVDVDVVKDTHAVHTDTDVRDVVDDVDVVKDTHAVHTDTDVKVSGEAAVTEEADEEDEEETYVDAEATTEPIEEAEVEADEPLEELDRSDILDHETVPEYKGDHLARAAKTDRSETTARSAEDTTTETDRTDKGARRREETRPFQKFKEVKDTETEEGKVPVPLPRRSIRKRDMPLRYGEYYTHQMVARPVDSKLNAVDTILQSVMSNEIDGEIAHKMIAAIYN